MDPLSLRLDPFSAGKLCYCFFVQATFDLCALSTYPVLCCFLHCLLNPLVCFPIDLLLLLHTISSPLIKEVENISGDPWHFPVTFIPKYLTGCISHYCIVGGNHGSDVHVLISQTNEWCEFPTYCCLESACHIWSLNFSRSNLSLG